MAQVLSPGAVPAPIKPVDDQQEWYENLNVHLICRDCRENPPDLREDHASGDLICNSCGLVLQERAIDTTSEWRTFANDDQGNDDPSRVGEGPNQLLNGNQLATNIQFLDGSMRSKELNRAQTKSNLDKGNKNLLLAYKQIDAYCNSWQVSTSVSDTAKHIYKDVEESKSLKGKNQEALIAACLFVACRRNGVQRSFKEVQALTQVNKKEIGKMFKIVENYLSTKSQSQTGTTTMLPGGATVFNEEYKPSQAADSSELIPRTCSMLGLDIKITNIAVALATMNTQIGATAGRSPLSAAAACIYMASCLMGHPRTPKQLQRPAGVSEGTIRQAYKLLFEHIDELLTEDIIARGADREKLPKPST